MKHKILLLALICLLSFSLGFSSFSANIVTGTGGNFTETDTLQSVTDRGSVTTQNITASYFFGDGSQLTNVGVANVSMLVPYTGATQSVDLEDFEIKARNIAFQQTTPIATITQPVHIDGDDLVFTGGGLRVERGSTDLFESTFNFWMNLEDVNWGVRFDPVVGSAAIGNGRFIVYRPNLNILRFRLTDSIGFQDIDVAKDMVDEGWHMMTYVIGETDYRLYVNGDLVGNRTLVDMNLNANTFFNFMGTSRPTTNGRLDGIQIYDAMLTAKQIKDLFNNGQGSLPIVKNNLARHYSAKFFTGNTSEPTGLYQISSIAGITGATNLIPYVGADRDIDIGSNRLYVNERVGINNTEPLYDLDVTGNARFTGTVRATDFITTSMVADFESDQRSLDKLDNIAEWTRQDNTIDYAKHYSYVQNYERHQTGTTEIVVTYEDCEDEMSKCETKTRTVLEPIYEDVLVYGLSMETRVAEMEKMIWELKQDNEQLQSQINQILGVKG